MANIQSLPNKILHQIVTYLGNCRENQLALKGLCSMSRQLNAIAEPSLYSYFNDGIEDEQMLLRGLPRRRAFSDQFCNDRNSADLPNLQFLGPGDLPRLFSIVPRGLRFAALHIYQAWVG